MRKLDDGREVLEDGEGVTVGLEFMDARQRAVAFGRYGAFNANDHMPHHAAMTDELREIRTQSRATYVADLTSAWKSPRSLSAVDKSLDNRTTTDADADPMRRRARAYDEMVQRVTNAWRTPHKDFAEPDMGSRPQELALRRRLRNEPDEPDADDAQGRRDAAWARYRDQLASAWKTHPNAATQIERQAEAWRGGK